MSCLLCRFGSTNIHAGHIPGKAQRIPAIMRIPPRLPGAERRQMGDTAEAVSPDEYYNPRTDLRVLPNRFVIVPCIATCCAKINDNRLPSQGARNPVPHGFHPGEGGVRGKAGSVLSL